MQPGFKSISLNNALEYAGLNAYYGEKNWDEKNP